MPPLNFGYTATPANANLDVLPQAIPGGGRTAASLGAYLANNAVFNALDFRAKGDGAQDDTTFLAAAIAAAVLVGGCVLLKRTASYYKVSTLTLPAGAVIIAEPGAEIRSLTATALSVTGSCTLRSLKATAPTAVAGAKGIDNTGFGIDAFDCVFTGNTNRLGDTGTSRYLGCQCFSLSTLGTTAWSATNSYIATDFRGQNGADVQGGLFDYCRFIGDGDGVTNGEGWGMHMPLTTANPAPDFAHCVFRGNGLAAYAIGLGNQGRPLLHFCDILGTRWGIYYRTDSCVVAEFCRIVGGDYGIEFNKVLASPTTVPTLANVDSSLRHCFIDATNVGTNFDVAAPTTSAYGMLNLENCSYGQIVADDALGGSTESSVATISGESGWVRNQLKVNAPPVPHSGDEYVASNVATFPHRRMFWGTFWTQFLMAHVDSFANRPIGVNQYTGYLYYDLDVNGYAMRDADGNWRPINSSKPKSLTLNSATPSVADGTSWVTNSAAGTVITNFTNGVDGQFLFLRAADANTTVQNNGATIITKTGANVVMTVNQVMILWRQGGVWYQVV